MKTKHHRIYSNVITSNPLRSPHPRLQYHLLSFATSFLCFRLSSQELFGNLGQILWLLASAIFFAVEKGMRINWGEWRLLYGLAILFFEETFFWQIRFDLDSSVTDQRNRKAHQPQIRDLCAWTAFSPVQIIIPVGLQGCALGDLQKLATCDLRPSKIDPRSNLPQSHTLIAKTPVARFYEKFRTYLANMFFWPLTCHKQTNYFTSYDPPYSRGNIDVQTRDEREILYVKDPTKTR